MGQLPLHFSDIEWVGAQIRDREAELERLPKWLQRDKGELKEAGLALKYVKEAAHLIYDVNMAAEADGMTLEEAARVKAQMKRWGRAIKIEKLDYTIRLEAVNPVEVSSRRIQDNLLLTEERYRKLA
jgi:hypothetical protein